MASRWSIEPTPRQVALQIVAEWAAEAAKRGTVYNESLWPAHPERAPAVRVQLRRLAEQFRVGGSPKVCDCGSRRKKGRSTR